MQASIKSEHKENSRAWWDERFSKSGETFLYSKEPSSFVLEYFDLLPARARVLDIACGEGRNAVALAAKGCEVLAFDFSATAIKRAEGLAKDSNVQVTFKSLDLDFYIPDLLSFDAIICSEFRPAPTLLKNLARGLKQNGHLIMEAWLMAAARAYPQKLEVFECYKPMELLHAFVPGQPSFQVAYYSELGPKWGEKAYLIAKKAQLL